MKSLHVSTWTVVAALTLAACGGGAPASPAASPSAPSAAAKASTAAAASIAPAASSPAAKPSAAASAPASAAAAAASAAVAPGGAEWDALVAAAKREGKITCGCPPIPPVKDLIIREFTAAFPGIELDYQPGALPQFTSKVTSERAAGQFLQDIYFWGLSIENFQLSDANAFDPLVPALIHPEVKDEKVWGGWDKAFMDSPHKYLLAFWKVKTNDTKYNAASVEPGSLKSYTDLLDPKFKGKIVWWDPRIGGGGITAATIVYSQLGEDKLKALMVDQQPLFVQNGSTDIAERMIRGGYLIGVGAGDITAVLKPYLDAGVKFDIRDADWGNLKIEGMGYGAVGLFNKAAHPNTAKLFANWLLMKDMQGKLSKATNYNSRRGDVPPAAPQLVAPADAVVDSQSQEFIQKYQPPVTKLIREWRPQ